jgi:hypothetical protein
MNIYRERKGTASLILNLGTRKWVVSFRPRVIYPLERIPVPTEWEVEWVSEPTWTFLEKK